MLNGLPEAELQEMLTDTYGDRIQREPLDLQRRAVFDGGWWADNLVAVVDPDVDTPNPVDAKYNALHEHYSAESGRMSKSMRRRYRALTDPNLKPNTEERTRLDLIVKSPSHSLTGAQKDLLWRFRFSLTHDKRALTKFIMCVKWEDANETKQAAALLKRWESIDIASALRLLGREDEFKNELVRQYAVNALQRASDEELIDYLLQLVQALRYENHPEAKTHAKRQQDAASKALRDRQQQQQQHQQQHQQQEQQQQQQQQREREQQQAREVRSNSPVYDGAAIAPYTVDSSQHPQPPTTQPPSAASSHAASSNGSVPNGSSSNGSSSNSGASFGGRDLAGSNKLSPPPPSPPLPRYCTN
jgi:hypothetical protein